MDQQNKDTGGWCPPIQGHSHRDLDPPPLKNCFLAEAKQKNAINKNYTPYPPCMWLYFPNWCIFTWSDVFLSHTLCEHARTNSNCYFFIIIMTQDMWYGLFNVVAESSKINCTMILMRRASNSCTVLLYSCGLSLTVRHPYFKKQNRKRIRTRVFKISVQAHTTITW